MVSLFFPLLCLAADLCLGGVHQLEASDGGSVSVSDLKLLRETLH